MKTLVKTKGLSREEWLKYRTQGIGGSEVSVIAGINHFRSIFQLWLEKTGQVEVKEEENRFTHWGQVLESVVKQEFMRQTGLKVRAKNEILQSEEYPFMLADLDGVIYENGKLVIFEAKTATAYKQDVWEHGVPEEYILQVQHYMAVTGAGKSYIAALVGGNRFYYYEVRRDDELIRKIIAMESHFWKEYVLKMKEPLADGSEATSEYLNQRYGDSNGASIELPEEAGELCESYERISEQLRVLKERKEELANQLKCYLKENEVGVIGDRKISWKKVTTTSFDKKRLEAEHKDLYDTYVTQSCYRRFMVA